MWEWTIAICDDDNEDREYLNKCCNDILENSGDIFCFSDGSEFLRAVENGFSPKILLLDISMKETNGIHVKESLERIGEKIFIIFTTDYPDYMPEAFGVNVLGYLKKPVEKVELEAIFSKIKHRYFAFSTLQITDISSKSVKINIHNISKIEAEDHYTKVILKNKHNSNLLDSEKFIVRKTMNEWENELDERVFVRLNKSVIINMSTVEKLGKNVAICSGEEIKISRSKKSDIVRSLANYQEFVSRF